MAGLHAVRELLKVRPQSVSQVWIRADHRGHRELDAIFGDCERLGLKVQSKGEDLLSKVTSVHQGIVAFAREAPDIDLASLAAVRRAVLIVLDEVEDPQNLGAILRTAWLFGVRAILTPETRAAPLTATVSKVAQGGAEHVPVVRVSGLIEEIRRLKAVGFWVFGLSHLGQNVLYRTEIPEKVIWVLGSESSGLRKSVERECDQLVAIPQQCQSASLNVSVAAAVALWETCRGLPANTNQNPL